MKRPTRKRLREARARLSAIQGERSRRRFQELAWSALVKLHADGRLPQSLLEQRPGLAEALTAAAGPPGT